MRLLLVDLLAVLSKDELVHAGHGEGQHATFSGVAVSLVAQFVFDPHFGLLQDLLHRTGIEVPDLYQNPQWALFTVTVNHGCGAGGERSPRVMTLMMSNTCSELISTVIDKKNVVSVVGATPRGEKVVQRLAPPISVASNQSRRSPCNAAR